MPWISILDIWHQSGWLIISLCLFPACLLWFSFSEMFLIFLYSSLIPLSFCICTSAGTSEPCTSASRAADRRRTSDASTGPWCTSMPMSTCSVYWRHFWRALHSWYSSSASWSRRTGPKRCSVRSASGLYTETADICFFSTACVWQMWLNVLMSVRKLRKYDLLLIYFWVEIFTH